MTEWELAKRDGGSTHYKTSGVEPIDLYRAFHAFRPFALCSIIKYASRNMNVDEPVREKDLEKIIHYATLLKADLHDVPTEGTYSSSDQDKHCYNCGSNYKLCYICRGYCAWTPKYGS